jgi:hypothetical protein
MTPDAEYSNKSDVKESDSDEEELHRSEEIIDLDKISASKNNSAK